MALLTAAVKLFIYKSHSDTTKALVHKVLKWATEEVDNPDLRDRGFMYWRMLAINPSVAGEIVLAEKPAITTDSDRMDRGALDQLLLHTGTLGSIYHKNPEVRFHLARSDLYQHYIRFRHSSVMRPEKLSRTALRSTSCHDKFSYPSIAPTSLQQQWWSQDQDLRSPRSRVLRQGTSCRQTESLHRTAPLAIFWIRLLHEMHRATRAMTTRVCRRRQLRQTHTRAWTVRSEGIWRMSHAHRTRTCWI